MEFTKKQIRAIFITGILILVIILLFLVISIMTVTNNKNKNNVDISMGFKSIKEIIEYYGCKYENDTYKTDREYPFEIKLVFKHYLYENNESNEKFYNMIIESLAKYLNYTNFKMIDTDNDIKIEVICKDRQIQKILINDIEDYFIYINSQLELTQYKEIKLTNLIPNVESIDSLINNNWSTDTNFGMRESIFKNYNIYFDEGIKTRKIGSNIYNIIFTKKYTEPVLNNIKVGASLKAVKESLGTPAFEDEEANVIGYKGNQIYAFFTEDEISIYRNRVYEYDEFWKLVDIFLEEDMEFKEFMNELTYLWKDFSQYEYSSDYMFIAYPNRGVEIKLNYDNESGIILYNNISENLSITKNYLEHTEFLSKLKLDSVFEAEKRRIKEQAEFKAEYKEFEKEQETTSMEYYVYFENDDIGNNIKTYFISKNEQYPNRELNETVDTYVWINDICFVYSINGQGIYCFDVLNGNKVILTETGSDNFKIESFKNNILTYDGKELVLEY